MRHFRFWGKIWLICIGTAAAAALVLILFAGLQYSDASDVKGMITTELSVFPYYLFVSGMFVLMVVTVNYFQQYFSVLLSMNCTRRSIAGGIALTNLAVILTICGFSALICRLLPGDVTESTVPLLPLLTGVLLIECAVIMAIGITILRWGKLGIIILVILGLVTGGFCGMLFALNSYAYEWLMELGSQLNFYPVLWAGLGLYIIAAVLVRWMTRGAEVRA